ncbi:MAG TPA: glycerate kinase [Ardenticatenaceae bacterium]
MTLTLSNRNPTRDNLLAIMEAALEAADPFKAVQRAIRRDGSTLLVGDTAYDLDHFESVWVLGAGKGGAPMAQAIEAVLGDYLAGGMVVVKEGYTAPLERIALREASHPVPNAAGLAAGEEMLRLAAQATKRDLVICLLSGGGSALLEALHPPLTLSDLQATTVAMLRSGATINEMNVIRKHLSRVKGGQLAKAIAPATLITFALSDVVGSPLDAIASGPTVPDRSTWEEVEKMVVRRNLSDSLPRRVQERIDAGLSGEIAETPKASDPVFESSQVILVGDNAIAAQAACGEAERRGYHGTILTTFLEGEAREVAKVAVALGREVQAFGRPVAAPACLIFGGETTVTLRGNGKGGRNQELALAAALSLENTTGITLGTLATDGSDGPTDGAGAIVDGTTAGRARAQGMRPNEYLSRNDAYPLLNATGELLRSGPTNTNVNDLLFVLVEAAT